MECSSFQNVTYFKFYIFFQKLLYIIIYTVFRHDYLLRQIIRITFVFSNKKNLQRRLHPNPNSRIYIKLSLSILNTWRYRSVTGNLHGWIAPPGVLRHKFRHFSSCKSPNDVVVSPSGRGYFSTRRRMNQSLTLVFSFPREAENKIINKSVSEFSRRAMQTNVFKYIANIGTNK